MTQTKQQKQLAEWSKKPFSEWADEVNKTMARISPTLAEVETALETEGEECVDPATGELVVAAELTADRAEQLIGALLKEMLAFFKHVLNTRVTDEYDADSLRDWDSGARKTLVAEHFTLPEKAVMIHLVDRLRELRDIQSSMLPH